MSPFRTRWVALMLVAAAGCGGPGDDGGPSSPSGTPPSGPPSAGPTTPTTPTTPVTTGFAERTLVDSGTTYRYQVFVPTGYTAAKKWPVVLFLHGSGEIGTDNVKQLSVGLGPVVRAQAATFPAIVVFPQLTRSTEGSAQLMVRLADASLRQTMAEFSVDSTRVYETGISMGAYLGWQLPVQSPSRFAALVPIAGGMCIGCVVGPPEPADRTSVYATVATRLKSMPIWYFHGAVDSSDPVATARSIAQVLQQYGVPLKYTEYPDANHQQTWERAYADPALWSWLFAQRR